MCALRSAETLAAVESVPVRRGERGAGAAGFQWREFADEVAAEAPLTLRVEGRAVAVVMRTPGHDRELAAGFLLTEGVIRSARDIFEISVCPSLRSVPGGEKDRPYTAYGAWSPDQPEMGDPGDSVDVLLMDKSAFDPDKLTRHVFTSSSCGICSKTGLKLALEADQILQPGPEPVLSAKVLGGFPEKLRAAQPAFAATGGLHACAFRDAGRGEIIRDLVFEDVGRHNAVDKLLGRALLSGIPLEHGVLLLSGRISFELVQKALAARIPVIAAVGAPSSLAVAYAEAAGITLCGFVREERVNVYTHPVRVA